MAGTSNAPLSRTSSSPTDSQFHSEPPYSGSNPSGSPHLSVGRLAGAFLSGSGRAPLTANGGAAPPQTDCKMVEVHGAKVASFTVNGVELICLPQVFELFLKHLVGGLHTVYTKLKRLDISPVVCSVEQVRILRGLGAIQPGVNRCKLITRADFETLYRDCTNASSRPGRPPKRSLGIVAMADNSRVLPHGLISPALLSQPGLTAATMAEALALQKMRLMMGFHANSEQQWHHDADRTTSPSELDDAGASEGSWEKDQHVLAAPLSMAIAPPPGSASLRLNTLQQRSTLLANRLSDLPFMVMPHPLLPVGLPPAGVAMAMNQMSQLSGLANMAAMSHVQEEESKSLPGTPSLSPSPSDDDAHLQEPTSQSPSRASSSLLSSSPPPAPTPELDETAEQHNDAKKPRTEKDESLLPLPFNKPTYEKLPLSVTQANPALAPFLLAEGLSSMETLLTNIQGLLKVAVQSARCQDKQNQMERKELKVELDKERDARQTLQRQLSCELQTRVSIQKRLKKEKKAKRRLQEALDFESRRRQQVERALKHSDLLADAVIPDIDLENKEQENPAAQENRPFSKPPLLF